MSAIRQAACVLIGTLLVIALMLTVSTVFFGVPFPSPLRANGASILYECPECGEVHEHRSATIEVLDDTEFDEEVNDLEPVRPVPIELGKTERIDRLSDRLSYAESERIRIAEEKAAAEEAARIAAEEAVAAEAARQAELEAQAAAEAAAQSEQSPMDSESSAPASVTLMNPMTISFLGTTNSYIDTPFWGSAPENGAGLWAGSDSTTDGSWGYFIGHHPGDFYAVMNMGIGDVVRVCDRNGNSRSYSVVDVFTVADTTYWEDLQERVCGHGESVILQTCVGDKCSYRIVIAV